MDSVTCAAEEAILSFRLGGGCQSPSFMFPPACSSFMAKQCFQEKSFLFWELLVAVQWVATILQCREMCPCCSRPWWKGIICPLCLSDQAFSFDTTCPISSTEYPGWLRFCPGGVRVALRREPPGAHLEVCSICRERILLLLRVCVCERWVEGASGGCGRDRVNAHPLTQPFELCTLSL